MSTMSLFSGEIVICENPYEGKSIQNDGSPILDMPVKRDSKN